MRQVSTGPLGSAVARVRVEVAGRSVVLSAVELGLACCGIEARQARRAHEHAIPSGPAGPAPGGATSAGEPDRPAEDGTEVNVLVVAGTVTSRLAPALAAAYAELPEPRAVLSFGACAATGGPYWDSYSVLPGAHEVVPVDVWVPGCPPRPEDLLAGLEEVVRGLP